ncbi:bifunctional adenosylcobinamide kinase/adenosylcobinamide-phosphate guanylyltransferase [Enterococcus sp.]|uniref:bifunctional adenosylcobinamide kinase/adenosylcobinamide-phosphate guanylyltransferase n=1 Tax=Enterococcus sp. TaxID=35783 RepID=UPI00290CA500|nr:bifunctional adenosylcobinamide kinase/adenosylcobinamide-phosphate guanylyltransferase [Enterococcus sp.]MDU5333592.1 bifunctional adenosylcobinamide kinase/adenosylcobinamide-phosphate guanylyltransferase [Enterococcus sp.]
MGEITLVTGGARSGKSAFAESLLDTEAEINYIATNCSTQDDEMATRVMLHQHRRPKNWQTTETYLVVSDVIEQSNVSAHLLDCATMLTTNYFFELMKEQFGDDFTVIDEEITKLSEKEKMTIEAEILNEWYKILKAAKKVQSDLVVVTNEVGLGIVPENAFTRWFRDVLGLVNQSLGKEADAVFLVVAGIPMKIK